MYVGAENGSLAVADIFHAEDIQPVLLCIWRVIFMCISMNQLLIESMRSPLF